MAFSVRAGTCVVPCSQTSVLLVCRAPVWNWRLYHFLPSLSPHSLSQVFGRTELPVPSLALQLVQGPKIEAIFIEASIRTWANSCCRERGMYISISVLQAMCHCGSMTLGDWVLRWYRRSGILRMHFSELLCVFLALSRLLDLKHW